MAARACFQWDFKLLLDEQGCGLENLRWFSPAASRFYNLGFSDACTKFEATPTFFRRPVASSRNNIERERGGVLVRQLQPPSG
jgi:hypothetical protein